MNKSVKFFWDSVKHYMTDEGLKEVARLYPELREEIGQIAKQRKEDRNLIDDILRDD